MTATSSLSRTATPMGEADLRADCEDDLALLGGLAHASTEMALELQRRTMQAMAEDALGVPARAVIAFNRVSRVARQTIMLRSRLRRELRDWDKVRSDGPSRQPSVAPMHSPPQAERRADGVLNPFAEGDAYPDDAVERLAAEACERLDQEELDEVAPVGSIRRHAQDLREQLRIAAEEGDLPSDTAVGLRPAMAYPTAVSTRPLAEQGSAGLSCTLNRVPPGPREDTS